jgi:hypothetical protein
MRLPSIFATRASSRICSLTYRRFRRDHRLDAFDLFSIVVWKANRAKSKVARRLLKGGGSLETAATRLTSALYKCKDDNARLVALRFEWGLGLPSVDS